MSDPKRLVDSPGALAPEARRLVQAGRELDPPRGAVDRGWSDFQALNGFPPSSLGGEGGSGAGPSSGPGLSGAGGQGLAGASSAGGLGALGTLKTFALGAALGVATVLGVQGASRMTRAGGEPALAVPAARTPEATVPRGAASTAAPRFAPAVSSPQQPAEPARPDARTTSPLSEPTSPAPVASTPPSSPLATGSVASFPLDEAGRESSIRAEARDIAVARGMIANGQASEALVFLGRSSERFRGGTLGQEREVLIIEALVGSGQRSVAERRAREFLSKNPQSPLGDRVKGVLP
jgi:hypothetical protein